MNLRMRNLKVLSKHIISSDPSLTLPNFREGTFERSSNIQFLFKWFSVVIFTLLLCITPTYAQEAYPTLEDFWEGRAVWELDIYDVGLPIGESDTIVLPDGTYQSYLHASNQSAGVIDQCGQPAEFPGCLTIWQSEDAAQSFQLTSPVCVMPCGSCPCDDQRDQITAQQYPRVAIADDGTHYMVYEWHAQTILRRSDDGITWSQDWDYLTLQGGVFPRSHYQCEEFERIGEHPNIRGQGDVCLVGGPPGIYVEGDTLYVFVMAGSAPAHMICYKGNRHGDLGDLERCDTQFLFTGAQEYGDIDLSGNDANDYFDFRYISSAEILKVGDFYYMAYEGIRGPSVLEFGRDNQFGLGFARSTSLDSQWELFEGNPILIGLADNWGVGHADLIVQDGITYMITATSQETRGRYVLVWGD